MTRFTRWTLLVPAALLALCVASGCLKKPRKEKLYCDPIRPPVGIEGFKVVTDLNMNPETGGYVTINAVVKADEDRDELDRLLKSLFRQAKGRKSDFKRHKGKLDRIDIRVYDTEAKAKAGGKDWLARVSRVSRSSEESYENKQKLPLLKWAKKALGKGTYQVLADHEAVSLEYSDAFMDFTTNKPKEKISYEVFANEFFGTMSTLFMAIKQLKKCTYIRKHEEKVVGKIWLSREQFERIGLLAFHEPACKGCLITPDGKTQCKSDKAVCTAASNPFGPSFRRFLEKKYNAVVGPLTQELMTKEISEAKYTKLKAKELRKVTRELLGKLPEDQVELVKGLR